jgi:gamma-glutamylcyclotransferase (GGCT)/AIG2-like uncharacterized protein YtfP
MSSLTENLATTEAYHPFFVYGTLRPGESNHYLLAGRSLNFEPAWAEGYLLYSCGTYPMALATQQAGLRLEGTLVTPSPEHYPAILRDLDQLEDYRPHNPAQSTYVRLLESVQTEHGPAQAWIYVARPGVLRPWYELITGGDWVAYRRAQNIAPFSGLED